MHKVLYILQWTTYTYDVPNLLVVLLTLPQSLQVVQDHAGVEALGICIEQLTKVCVLVISCPSKMTCVQVFVLEKGYLVAWLTHPGQRVSLPVAPQHVVVVGAQVRGNPCTHKDWGQGQPLHTQGLRSGATPTHTRTEVRGNPYTHKDWGQGQPLHTQGQQK